MGGATAGAVEVDGVAGRDAAGFADVAVVVDVPVDPGFTDVAVVAGAVGFVVGAGAEGFAVSLGASFLSDGSCGRAGGGGERTFTPPEGGVGGCVDVDCAESDVAAARIVTASGKTRVIEAILPHGKGGTRSLQGRNWNGECKYGNWRRALV